MQVRFTDEADYAACRAALRGGSRSFYLASFLLPGAVRRPATALYAFCRQADDAIDIGGRSEDALAVLHARLRDAYAGRPFEDPADRAFAATVNRFQIPAALPAALLDGFAWDAERRRYETLEELYAYAARVAGSVGAMMALIMDVRAPEALARACELGIAMQLSNIARDVGEDARAGRLYLPLQWLREAGIEPGSLIAAPAFSPALGGVVQRLLTEAEQLYERSATGIGCLPAACRPGIRAAQLLYAEIGREVARRGFDPISSRAVVSPTQKLQVLRRVFAGARSEQQTERLSMLDAARFLVDSVPYAPTTRRPKNFVDKLVWVLDLFERLERRDRLQQSGSMRAPVAAME
jgi:phytoene synthase